MPRIRLALAHADLQPQYLYRTHLVAGFEFRLKGLSPHAPAGACAQTRGRSCCQARRGGMWRGSSRVERGGVEGGFGNLGLGFRVWLLCLRGYGPELRDWKSGV